MEKEQFERRKKVINDLMHDKTYVPMKIKELAMVLGVSREKRGELEAVLDELVSEGKIEVSKRGKYQIAKSHLLTGKYTAHVKGFGFVEIEGQEEDIFIPEESSGGAFDRTGGSNAGPYGQKKRRKDRPGAGAGHCRTHRYLPAVEELRLCGAGQSQIFPGYFYPH